MKNKKNIQEVDSNNIPVHIGFIMDGNGRWATKRGLPRTAGHRAGVDSLTRVAEACRDFGVKILTIYAFSTENFKRSEKECKFIFDLVTKFAREKAEELKKNNTRLVVCGDLNYSDKIPEETKEALAYAVNETKDCTDCTMNLCISYGGRHEIVQAVNSLIKAGKTEVTEEDIENALYTSGQPNPDLIVRASGEQRLSNFLPWQSAYAELYFPKTHWPDFNKETVRECILEYQRRDRRFGKVK